MSISVQSQPKIPTPEQAAEEIKNIGAATAALRTGHVQGVEQQGGNRIAKDDALRGIAEASGFITSGTVDFLKKTVDGHTAATKKDAGAAECGIRQAHGSGTELILQKAAPHEPTTAPYGAGRDVAMGFGPGLTAAKDAMAQTVAKVAESKGKIPKANIPSKDCAPQAEKQN